MNSIVKRLLIVDDALIMRKRIRDIAQQAGWQVVVEAADGNQAIALYDQVQPDLVTMDIVMPDMDGVSALKQLIRQDPQANVVMISAVNQKDKLSECIQNGAIDFIVKPFDKSSLLRFFEKQLNQDN